MISSSSMFTLFTRCDLLVRYREGKIFVKRVGKRIVDHKYRIGYYFYERHKNRQFIPMTRTFYRKSQALRALKRFKSTGHLVRALSWVKRR